MDVLEIRTQELQDRIVLCQQKLTKKGLAGMVVSSDQNITYYANFRTPCGWNTFTRPTFMFIPVKGTPVLYTQIMFTPVAKEKATCYDQKNFDSLLGPTIPELVTVMKELNMVNGKVGFELGHEQRIGFQVDTFLALKEALTNVEIVDVADIIWEQRVVKSESEITCIRRACQATSYAFTKVFENIKRGMNERDITMLAQQYMLEGGAERPGFHIITSGYGSYDRICDSGRDRKLQQGDFLWLDMGAVYNGYWADFCRAGVVGDISEDRDRMQDVVHEVTMEVGTMLKPGTNVKDIAKACMDGMQSRGIKVKFDCGRLGHGVGLNSTEPPSITLDNDYILEEGMVIALEPGIFLEDGLYDVEEIFVVRKNGGECLSDGDRKLHLIP